MAKSHMHIPIHSVVDIITNSSSEIFVTAYQNAAEQMEKFIDAILLAGGSTTTSKELFDIKVVKLFTQREVNEMSEEETKKLLDDPYYPKIGGDLQEVDYYAQDLGEDQFVVAIIPKVENEQTKLIARTLSDYAPFHDVEAH